MLPLLALHGFSLLACQIFKNKYCMYAGANKEEISVGSGWKDIY